jgi:nitrogen regulatory protein PII
MNKMVIAIIGCDLLEKITSEMRREGVHFSYSEVKGFGRQVHLYHEDIHDRIKIEVIVEGRDVERVKNIILGIAPRGIPGAGIIAVYNIEEFIDLSKTK